MEATAIEAFGRAWASWLMQANAWVLAMFVMVLVVERLLASHVTAGWRMSLYVVVLVRLCVPSDWASPFGVLPSSASAGLASGGVAVGAGVTSQVPVTSAFVEVSALAAPSWSWGTALLAVHGLGVLLLLARFVVAYRRLARITAGCVPAPGLRVARGRVLEHPCAGPLAMGLLDPVVVLPSAALELETDQLESIARHEESHLRHHDPLLQTALSLVCALAWPVVGLWLVASRLRTLMEVRADAEATAPLGRVETVRYGELMLRVATMGGMTPAPSVGLSHHHLRSRLRSLGRRPRTPVAVQALAVSLAAATCVVVVAQRRAEPIEEPTPSVAPVRVAAMEESVGCVLDRPWRRPDDPKAEEAHQRLEKAEALRESGELRAAVLELEETAWLAASIEYDDLAAYGAGRLVSVNEELGETEDALAWAKHATAAYRRSEPSRGQIRFLRSLAEVQARHGLADDAAAALARSRALESLCP